MQLSSGRNARALAAAALVQYSRVDVSSVQELPFGCCLLLLPYATRKFSMLSLTRKKSSIMRFSIRRIEMGDFTIIGTATTSMTTTTINTYIYTTTTTSNLASHSVAQLGTTQR